MLEEIAAPPALQGHHRNTAIKVSVCLVQTKLSSFDIGDCPKLSSFQDKNCRFFKTKIVQNFGTLLSILQSNYLYKFTEKHRFSTQHRSVRFPRALLVPCTRSPMISVFHRKIRSCVKITGKALFCKSKNTCFCQDLSVLLTAEENCPVFLRANMLLR